MKRWVFSILLVVMLGLAACAPTSTAPAATQPLAATNTSAATEAATEAVTETPAATRTPLPRVPASCEVVDIIPAADPQLLAALPPVSASDHVKGPDSATMTIIEYSDYQ